MATQPWYIVKQPHPPSLPWATASGHSSLRPAESLSHTYPSVQQGPRQAAAGGTTLSRPEQSHSFRPPRKTFYIAKLNGCADERASGILGRRRSTEETDWRRSRRRSIFPAVPPPMPLLSAPPLTCMRMRWWRGEERDWGREIKRPYGLCIKQPSIPLLLYSFIFQYRTPFIQPSFHPAVFTHLWRMVLWPSEYATGSAVQTVQFVVFGLCGFFFGKN